VNPSEVQSLHPRCTCIGHGNADARLSAQKRKSLREVLIEGFWRKRPIVIPPYGSPINLRLRSLRDLDFHGSASHDDARASRALPPLKLFAAVGLGDGKKKLGLSLGSELRYPRP
jgi:hypothetical protein